MSRNSSVPKLNQLSSDGVMGQLLAQQQTKLQILTSGQVLDGRVLEIRNKVLILDVGAKSEGLVADREFENAASFISTLKTGDMVQAVVVVPETSSGQPLLSVGKAAAESGWKRLEQAFRDKAEVDVRVEGSSRGGLSVVFDGIYGFVPTSQTGSEIAKNPQVYTGKTIKVKVSEVNKAEERAVFSERAISEAGLVARQEEALKGIKEGEKFSGQVVGIVNFGVFVQILKNGVQLDGLVHLSEISWGKTPDPTKALSIGEKVEVVVIGTSSSSKGESTGRLALSIKRTQEDPWEKQVEKFTPDQQVVKGMITKMSDAGAFIEVAPGVEGLLRFNKIPDGASLKEGAQVDVFIEEIDRKNKKIALGMVLKAKPVGYK